MGRCCQHARLSAATAEADARKSGCWQLQMQGGCCPQWTPPAPRNPAGGGPEPGSQVRESSGDWRGSGDGGSAAMHHPRRTSAASASIASKLSSLPDPVMSTHGCACLLTAIRRLFVGGTLHECAARAAIMPQVELVIASVRPHVRVCACTKPRPIEPTAWHLPAQQWTCMATRSEPESLPPRALPARSHGGSQIQAGA